MGVLKISRSMPSLLGAADPVVEEMAKLTPDFSTGNKLHDLYVNKIMSALPGNYSQLFGTGPSFQSIFFPGWQPDSLLPLVTQFTGLDEEWWRQMSIRSLCECMYEVTSSIRKQLRIDNIRADLATNNNEIGNSSAALYSRVLADRFPPFTSLLKKVDPVVARPAYREVLIKNVQTKQLWYGSALWTSPDWEMFNHYAKYMALGASPSDVDALIQELLNAGLPIPDVVRVTRWRNYREEFRERPKLEWNDFSGQARGPIQQTRYINVGRSVSALPEGNCYEFTARSQPGTGYRQLPSGCCFSGDTEVLCSDKTTRRLDSLRPGERILTRNGSAAVTLVPTPARAGRPLYRVDGAGPAFTGTHPFLNEAFQGDSSLPQILCHSPQQLRWGVPTLGERGVGSLTAGSRLYARDSFGNSLPPHIVSSVETIDPHTSDYVYDINVLPEDGNASEFWVGKDQIFFLSMPEFPLIANAGAATFTYLALVEGILRDGSQLFAHRNIEWLREFLGVMDQYGAAICRDAAQTALNAVVSPISSENIRPVVPRLEAIYEALRTSDQVSSAAFAALLDLLLLTTGDWMQSTIALGWRNLQAPIGNILAITLSDLQMSPSSPISAQHLIKLKVSAGSIGSADSQNIWNRTREASTRFYAYFDQIVYFEVEGLGPTPEVCFAASLNNSELAALSGGIPISPGEGLHSLYSAPIRDSQGETAGFLNFDIRLLTRGAAEAELEASALWLDSLAETYADQLGKAMVAPLLSNLEAMLSVVPS